MQYIRKCPKCKININYNNKLACSFANKNKTLCKKCRSENMSFSDLEVIKILSFNERGMSNKQIAKELGVKHYIISYFLKRKGKISPFCSKVINMVSENEAKCSKCNIIKSVDEFQFGRKNQKYEYRFSYCNSCRKKQVYLSLNSDINKFLSDRFNRLKRRSKKSGIKFAITKKQFIEQFNNQNGLCFYTDTKLICKVGQNLNKNSLSIDRIDCKKGYIFGNIVFASNRINTIKSNLTLNELKTWMPAWYFRIKKFLNSHKKHK